MGRDLPLGACADLICPFTFHLCLSVLCGTQSALASDCWVPSRFSLSLTAVQDKFLHFSGSSIITFQGYGKRDNAWPVLTQDKNLIDVDYYCIVLSFMIAPRARFTDGSGKGTVVTIIWLAELKVEHRSDL